MFLKFLFLFGSVSLAAPVLAQQTAPAAPIQTASAAPQGQKQFCRREQQLGSIMPGKKVCRTKAEWDAIDEANNANAGTALNHRNNRLNGAGGG
jgi:predicted transglutaminase-like cysteine proteinase